MQNNQLMRFWRLSYICAHLSQTSFFVRENSWKLQLLGHLTYIRFLILQQEGQVALNRSHEFCLKLTYRYMLKGDHVPGDAWGGVSLGDTIYIPKIQAMSVMASDKKIV